MCVYGKFVFMCVVVTVCGSVGMNVVCLCRGCDGCCVFYLKCEASSCMCSCIKRVSVSSCRCCMFVSCVHLVAVLNAVICMTCSLLMLVENVRGILQTRSHDFLVRRHACLLLFSPCCCGE